jgi:hypothetical protein
MVDLTSNGTAPVMAESPCLFVALSIRIVVAFLSAAYMGTKIFSPPLSHGEGSVSLGACPRKRWTVQRTNDNFTTEIGRR